MNDICRANGKIGELGIPSPRVSLCLMWTQFYDRKSTFSLKLCIRKFSEQSPSIAELIPLLFPGLEDLVIHHVHPREFQSLQHLRSLHQLKSFMIGELGG